MGAGVVHNWFRILFCGVTGVIPSAWSGQPIGTTGDVLESLRPEHPRLLMTAEMWIEVHKRREVEAGYQALAQLLVRHAEKALPLPAVKRKLTGRRLLGVSREALRRIVLHAAAWRMTGAPRFLEAAQREMLAAAAFDDWNPSHFLDTAEMTAALAIGYDWLYEALDDAARRAIREAIVRLGLRPAIEQEPKQFFYRARTNWNQVCLGGLALGALAIAEDEPDLARDILSRVARYIGNGLSSYAPDGVYPEGPTYWTYGTSYQVVLIEALRTALGTDWDMPRAPGFLASAEFMVHAIGPTGLYFNFADGGSRFHLDPTLFWFAKERRMPALARPAQHNWMAFLENPAQRSLPAFAPLLLCWWPREDAAVTWPRFWHGRGPNPVAMWRTAWDDRAAVYFAIKGGGAAVSHGHMDAGSFVFDAGGVRWAVDLGAQDYHSLETSGVHLWDSRPGGQRWDVFRLNNHSHNTLTIDDQLHRATALASFVRADETGAEIDLSPVFEGQAHRGCPPRGLARA